MVKCYRCGFEFAFENLRSDLGRAGWFCPNCGSSQCATMAEIDVVIKQSKINEQEAEMRRVNSMGKKTLLAYADQCKLHLTDSQRKMTLNFLRSLINDLIKQKGII